MNKKVKKVWNIITTVLIVLVVLLAVALAGVRIFGVMPYAVLSPSMTPSYPVGAIVYVHSVKAADIAVGDVITFTRDSVTITHRVAAIDSKTGEITTKGDANKDPDAAPVKPGDVVGKVAFSIPMLGYAAEYLLKPPGLYAALAGIAVLLFLILLPELIGTFRKTEDKKAEEKQKRYPW